MVNIANKFYRLKSILALLLHCFCGRWKETIGAYQDRPGHPNSVWGYWSTDGLGLHEMLMLCEELDAEPVLVLNIGLSQV